MPIGEGIEAFHARQDVAFAIPAHRSGTGSVDPDAARWTGGDAFRADVGMNHGVDTRNQSWEVQKTAMERFALAVGADETLFSTNGSTENVHVAIMAAVRPGQTLVMARNGHKSAFSGLVLSGAVPVYVDPYYDERWQVAHGVAASDMASTLDAHPEAAAALGFTPTYYGVSSDVAGLAEVAHSRGVPLLTDDAWGLDYSFCSRLPPSAISSGADLAVGSVHKSLNGLCQTSVISRRGDRIDPGRLSLAFELEQSTSASSLLLSSIDAARAQFESRGEQMLGAAIDLATEIREAITDIPGLDLMGEEVLSSPGAAAFDPSHVTFDVTRLGLTGYEAADWLRERHGVHVELADYRRLMALITFADDDRTARRLIAALGDLAGSHEGAEPRPPIDIPSLTDRRLEMAMAPRDAFLGPTEMIPWARATGRVSAEMICPYPPGVPVVAPGEVLSDTVVDYLRSIVGAGAMVEGAVDETLDSFRFATRSDT